MHCSKSKAPDVPTRQRIRQCPLWVSRVASGPSQRSWHVCYASNSDPISASQRSVAMPRSEIVHRREQSLFGHLVGAIARHYRERLWHRPTDMEALQHYARERRGLWQTKEEPMTQIDTDYLATGGEGATTGLHTFFVKEDHRTPIFVMGVGGLGSFAGVFGQTETMAPPNIVAGVYGAGNLQRGVFGFSSQNVGVHGSSFLGTGVQGTSFRSSGIQGQSGVGTGVQGTSLRARGVTGISG